MISDPQGAQRAAAEVAGSDAELEARAGSLAARPLSREETRRDLDLAIRSTDLTTLRGSDTPERVLALCERAVRPDPLDAAVPAVAAVCVYPQLVPVAVERLAGTGVGVVGVAGGFPSGLTPLAARLLEIREVVAMGADEVDVVLNRSLVLAGEHERAFEELVAAREAAGAARMKVILETGELGSAERIAHASMLAMAAGADFLKTSTGTIEPGATPPAALGMMEAIRSYASRTGRRVGFKAAGGVRSAAAAVHYVTMARETLGRDWMTPDRFRIGASALLADLVVERRRSTPQSD